MKRILVLCSALALLTACGDDDGGTPDSGAVDSGAAVDAGTTDVDAGPTDVDAGSTETDAGPTDVDAGPAIECFVNDDCPADQRCECSEEDGCFCAIGVRGTGRNGIDTCATGNDCASSICVEGPSSGTAYYCSDVCETNDDCTGMLPRCISGVGICAREG